MNEVNLSFIIRNHNEMESVRDPAVWAPQTAARYGKHRPNTRSKSGPLIIIYNYTHQMYYHGNVLYSALNNKDIVFKEIFFNFYISLNITEIICNLHFTYSRKLKILDPQKYADPRSRIQGE